MYHSLSSLGYWDNKIFNFLNKILFHIQTFNELRFTIALLSYLAIVIILC